VFVSQPSELVPDQGVARRCLAVHDQHPSASVALQGFTHQYVVLEDLDGRYGPAKGVDAPVVLEQRLGDPDDRSELVAKISRREPCRSSFHTPSCVFETANDAGSIAGNSAAKVVE
jgi:hypothetical protein